MDDQDLNLRVNVETATVGELRTALKGVKTDLDAVSANDPNRAALVQEYSQLKTAIGQTDLQLKQSLPTWDAYRANVRNARVEKRALMFAITELSGVFDVFGEKFKPVTAALKESIGAGMGVSFALSMMGEKMSALSPIIGLVVAAGVGLIAFFNQTDETAKKAADEGLKKFADAIGGFGPEGLQRVKAQLQANIDNLQTQIKTSQTIEEMNKNGWVPIEQRNKNINDLIADQQAKLDKVNILLATQKDTATVITDQAIESGKSLAMKDQESLAAAEKLLSIASNRVEYDKALEAVAIARKKLEDDQLTTAQLQKKADDDATNKQMAADAQHLKDQQEELVLIKLSNEAGDLDNKQAIIQLHNLENTVSDKKLQYEIEILINKLTEKTAVVTKASLQDATRASTEYKAALIGAQGALNGFFNYLDTGSRQAKNVWDAMWIGMEQSAIRALEQVAEQAIETGLLKIFMSLFGYSGIQIAGGVAQMAQSAGSIALGGGTAAPSSPSMRLNGYGAAASSGSTSYAIQIPPVTFTQKGTDMKATIDQVKLIVNNRSMSISGTR